MENIKPMKNELSTINAVTYALSNGKEFTLTKEEVMRYLTKGNGKVTEQECVMFMKLCESQSLNPFTNDAYLIKYGEKSPATLVVSKDAMLKRANASGIFNGMESGIIVSANGKIEYREGSFYMKNETLVGGWAKVYVKGKEKPFYDAVSYDEYVQRNGEGGKPNANWTARPATMIEKVAIVHALRKAFPEALQGMYIEEEFDKERSTAENEQVAETENQYDISETETAEYTATASVDDLPFEEYPESISDTESDSVIDNEYEWHEVSYSYYKDNRADYEQQTGSYNPETKTIIARRKQ